MTKADQIFLDTLKRLTGPEAISEVGQNIRAAYADGEKAYTRFVIGQYEEYDLTKNEFPIINARPIAWKSAIKEMLWIYQDQSNNLDILKEKYGITWWDPWDIGDRTIGQRYGATVKRYDLINKLIKGLIAAPYTRRHIINLWQYADFEEKGGLDPCAFQTIWSVRENKLDCMLFIRSNDYLVAGHIDRIQYVALQMLIAKATGLIPGKFMCVVQNLHYYVRHAEQLEELLERSKLIEYGDIAQPILKLNTDKTDFYSFTVDDFEMIDYGPIKPQLKFELAI